MPRAAIAAHLRRGWARLGARLSRMPDERRGSSDPRSLYARSLKPRPRQEYLNARVFRPLAHLVVRALLPLPVPPPAVVVFHSVLGLWAAERIARGGLTAAALLLQLKTVLDNADGQLARARGEETEIGRYLDSELDLVVNAAVFWGLGRATERPALALAAFAALTLLLSLDFNLERAYRLERGEGFRPEPDAKGENRLVLGALRAIYGAVFAPQDRLIRQLDEALFEAVYRRRPNPGRRVAARLEYHDGFASAVLANLGLTTQLAALGLCLALKQPGLYLGLVLAAGGAVVPLQLRREGRAAEALL